MQPELIADCVHCGFCLPTCPTYSLWHEEMDSPRGRIHLMAGLVDGSLDLTDTVVEHFDRCLGCMACVPACPSGVQYDRLIETTRAHIEEQRRRPLGERMLRRVIFEVFPHRRRLRAALALRRLPAFGPFAPLKTVAPPWLSAAWPPEHLPGPGPRVALVAGCVQSVVFGDVNAATARVLAADGYDVHVPKAQSCCGALHAHAGRLDEGVARAQALAERSEGLRRDRHERSRLRLAPEGPRHPERRRRLRVARRPARAGRAQAAGAARRLSRLVPPQARAGHRAGAAAALLAIPGLELLEPRDQELCCGSAGIYNLVQPDAARELGDRKAEQVLATEPDAYASGNPGCLVQVTAALRRAGRPIAAFHPIELVDASIRGLDAADVLRAARR